MIDKILKFTGFIFFLIFPFFYLTVTSESYEYNKMFLLIFTVLFLFILYSLSVIRSKKIVFWGSSFTIPLFFLAGIYTISALFQSPNLAIALTTPLSVTTMIAGLFLYVLLTQTTPDEEKDNLAGLVVISAILVSLYVFASDIGLLPRSLFSPAGTILSTAIFLSVVSVYSASKLILKIVKNPNDAVFDGKDLFYAVSLFIILGTVFLIVIHLLTDQKPILLPLGFGWIVLMEILKNIKTLLLGVGPSNFLSAFVLAKPVIFNDSSVWNIIFTSSSSFLLTMATETGIFSVIFYFVILIKSIKLISRNHQSRLSGIHDAVIPNKSETASGQLTTHNYSFTITLIFALILQIVLPSSMNLFILTIILLSFASGRQIIFEANLSKLKVTSYLLVIPSLALMGLFIFFGTKAYLAEIYFKQSLDALVNNQGSTAYTLQQKAVSINPYLDRYHLAVSQLSLALANAISAKTTLAEEDKQNIPRLIQQAIDQGRTAVILYRTNVANWDNLARTYASLTNYAKDSDKWAILSYQQRLALDPYSPTARLSLGGFYLYLNRWQDAENIFREAVSLKPDFANAHYNLGFTLRQEKKYAESYKELQTALALVASNTPDATKIQDELKLIPEKYATDSAEALQESNNTDQTLAIIESTPSGLKKIQGIKPAINIQEPPVSPN